MYIISKTMFMLTLHQVQLMMKIIVMARKQHLRRKQSQSPQRIVLMAKKKTKTRNLNRKVTTLFSHLVFIISQLVLMLQYQLGKSICLGIGVHSQK